MKIDEIIKKLKINYQQIDSSLLALGVSLQKIEKMLAEIEEEFIVKFSSDPYSRLKTLAKRLKI